VRVLIVGGLGMLGHKVWQLFQTRFETWATVRRRHARFEAFIGADSDHIFEVDVTTLDDLQRVLESVRPDAVVNCVGIIKQLAAAKDPIASLEINALFPHRLLKLCRSVGARLIHISTDCVFSGRVGNRREADSSDAEDLYGRSKFLGEIDSDGGLTLRTSIIGRELEGTSGLVEWFLSNRGGSVKGYSHAIFSGLTTIELANVVGRVIETGQPASGLWHVSAEPISKLALLSLLNEEFHAEVTIEPSSALQIDRSLDSSRFRQEAGWVAKDWRSAIAEMARDSTPYDDWRRRSE
jgi:dTDP-4-dehydrorhamnose reductase